MKQSGYMARQREEREAENQMYLTAGEKTGFQKACDFIAIALSAPECMGKGVMSGEKISHIMEFAIDLCNTYHSAFEPEDPEADVWQERLDKHQRRIFKDKAEPFSARYRYIKLCGYEAKRKGGKA